MRPTVSIPFLAALLGATAGLPTAAAAFPDGRGVPVVERVLLQAPRPLAFLLPARWTVVEEDVAVRPGVVRRQRRAVMVVPPRIVPIATTTRWGLR